MTWIRRNLAAVLLAGVIAVVAILSFNGSLQWKRNLARQGEHQEGREGGEAGEKRISHGKIVLDEQDLKASGIVTAAIQDGTISETLEAPGEVDIAQDHLAHVTPPIPGRIHAIQRVVGDAVTSGTVLCTIESAELGGARAELQPSLAEAAVAKHYATRAYPNHARSTLLHISPAELIKKRSGKQFRNGSELIGPFVSLQPLFGCLLRRGNRLNHHHLLHHVALHRRALTSELVEFSLVPIKRVDLLPYDQRVLRALLHALSGALSRALVLFHVVSATHRVTDNPGQRFWRGRSLSWLARPRCAR